MTDRFRITTESEFKTNNGLFEFVLFITCVGCIAVGRRMRKIIPRQITLLLLQLGKVYFYVERFVHTMIVRLKGTASVWVVKMIVLIWTEEEQKFICELEYE